MKLKLKVDVQKTKLDQIQENIPVVIVTQEAQPGGLLEPRSLRSIHTT